MGGEIKSEEEVSDKYLDSKKIQQQLEVLLQLVPQVNEMQRHLSSLEALKEDVGSLKNDVGSLNDGVGSLKNDVGSLKDEITSLRTEVKTLRVDLDEGNEKSDRNFRRLTNRLDDIEFQSHLVMGRNDFNAPEGVRPASSGTAMHEPRSKWRSERPYRR